MKLVAYVRELEDISIAAEAGVDEVLVSPKALAVLGNLSVFDCEAMARHALALHLKPVLLWDSLSCDKPLRDCISALESMDLNLFSSVRVQEVGALEYLLQNTSSLVQFIAKSGAHNLESLQGWCRHIGDRLERIVVSTEIPRERLAQYIQRLPVAVETLGFGPILLFYSPRNLLSWRMEGSDSEKIPLEAIAQSEECPQSALRVIESYHGTVAFHNKDYSLVDRSEDLKSIGLGSFLIDLRLEPNCQRLVELCDIVRSWDEKAYKNFLERHPRPVTRCFYASNSTDVLFKRLRNQLLRGGKNSPIGRVVEAAKERHLIIEVVGKRNRLKAGQEVVFVTPNGKVLNYIVRGLRNFEGEPVEEVAAGDFALMPYISSITPVTALFDGRGFNG